MITERYARSDLATQFPEARELSDFFTAVESRAAKSGYVVCQFRVNGLNFSEKDEAKAVSISAEEVDLIEVLLDTPDNLLVSIVNNWVEELPMLIKKCDQLAVDLRERGLSSIYTPLVSLIDNCHFLTESLISIRSFSSVSQVVSAPEWMTNEQAMTNSVTESLKAFEKKDGNWLADVVEYDLAQCLQNWQSLLEGLQRTLQSPESTPILSGT